MGQTAPDFTFKPVTRRKSIQLLLGFSLLATLTGVVAPIIAYLWPQGRSAAYGEPVDVGAVTDFPPDSGQVVSVNASPVIVVNTKAGGLKAFSAICTHLGCVVTWSREKHVILCPCHDGLFSGVNGTVVGGPPPYPLSPYEMTVKDGQVLIGKPLGKLYGG